MTAFEIPPLQIDPASVPSVLLTSEPGSFAQDTFRVRDPKILEELLAAHRFDAEIRRDVEALRAELLNGTIRGLDERAADTDFWNRVSRDHIGRTWLDVPWYWAETFFYRRILQATRYFQVGEWFEQDPFAYKKAEELQPDAAPRKVDELLRDLPDDPAERFETILYASLWGNRTDLSYNVSAQHPRAARLEDERANLLVDDAPEVWSFLNGRDCLQISLIADNAGTELLMDLALIDLLLGEGEGQGDGAGDFQSRPHDSRPYADRVTLHLKLQPFFVSDAMPRDVSASLVALSQGDPAAQSLARRLREHIESGRLVLYPHWFYPTPFFYFQLPADLLAQLRGSDLVILKGDVNYRRVLGDAHWEPTTPFTSATSYFPAPLVCLRTLKAELIVGLKAGEAERLDALDKAWRVDGKRGLVQGSALKNSAT